MEAEVCIVGAGAAGGILALELARRGIGVVVLESGARHDFRRRGDYVRSFLRRENPWRTSLPELDRYTASGTIAAEPEPVTLDWSKTALVIIDMQRDFMEPGGFGETLGNDVSQLARAVKPIGAVLKAARETGMLVVHTREGHLSDLSDAPPAKVERGAPRLRIGDPGPMGRILIRGEAGHDIIPELYPLDSEIVIDKPGKGAFYATELGDILQKYGIENLLVCGVTTEVCVNTTVREANDRGYRCVVLADGCASYFPEFHEMGLKMIKAQGGIFGWVSNSAAVLEALSPKT
jgi:nicotinamidase-related amidase